MVRLENMKLEGFNHEWLEEVAKDCGVYKEGDDISMYIYRDS